MQLEAQHERIGIQEHPLAEVPSRLGALARFAETRLFEMAVWVLLVIWCVQLFSIWSGFAEWATRLQFPG
jgi:hypothetical protein